MAAIKVRKRTLGVAGTNCYFVYNDENKKAIVFDPADAGSTLYELVRNIGFEPIAIFLTHGHYDHIAGVKAFVESARNDGLDIKVFAEEKEKETLNSVSKNLSGMFGDSITLDADIYLKDGDTVAFDGIKVKVISTPGHTVGGASYYIEEGNLLISGDTLFCESVGRTDFPGGSSSTLIRNIKEKLFVLPGDTKVYPGHGEATTIEYEIDNNPFCG